MTGQANLPRRGFVLVLAMVLIVLLLVVGIAFLGVRPAQMREAQAAAGQAQARALAWAGLEDARLKLLKDYDFPPRGSVEQRQFSYAEQVLDPDGQVVGSYQVTIDSRWLYRPYEVLRISATGRALDANGLEVGVRTISLEQDRAEFVRGSSPRVANPNLFRFLNLVDEGSL